MYTNSGDKSGTIWYMYEWPLHFKPKLNNYKGIPLLGGQGEYPPLREDKTLPRGGADGINN